MEPQTWTHLQAPGSGQRLIAGPCEERIPMACRWEPRRRSMTKKVLLQRHRVQIGEASGPPKERLEPEARAEQHHHHPAPYPGDQRQHQHQRGGEGRRDRQEDAVGGSPADEGRIIVGGMLSQDKRDRRRADAEASVSMMEVEEPDSGSTAIATSGSSVKDRGDGGPVEAADAEERGRRSPAASTSEKRECPEPELSGDDEEVNGAAGGGSIGDVPAPPATTPAAAAAAAASRAASEIAGGGERALSVSPPAKGLVPSSRPLDVAVYGKMPAPTEAAVETPLPVVVTPSAVVAGPRGDGDGLRKDDVVVEVKTTAAGDPLYAFNKSAPARRGKWSRLEEEYANRIINDFDEGVLDAAAGVSLRTLLASKLHCDVMRVSKKFKGWACVGKRSFRPVHHLDGRTARAKETLFRMEQTWLRSITAGSNSNGYFSTVNARKKYARGFGTPSPLPKGGQEQCQPADLQQLGLRSEDRDGGGEVVGQGLGMRISPPSSKNPPLHRQQPQQQQQTWLAASGISSIANEVRMPVMTLERQVSRGGQGQGTSGTPPASHGSPRHVRPPPWPVASRGSALDNGAGVGPNSRNSCWAPYRQEESAAVTSRPSSAPQISSSHMQDSAPVGEQPTVTPRLGRYWSTRGRAGPGGLALPYQRGQGAAPPGGASIGGGGGDGDSDADLYPVYTKRARARSDGSTVTEVQHPTADGNTAGPDHRGYERFSWPQGSRLVSAAALGAGEVAPLGEQIARLQQRRMPRITDRRNENNAHGHVRDVQQQYTGSARGFTAPKSSVRAGGVPRDEHGRPVGAAPTCSAGDDGGLKVQRPYASGRSDGVRLARNENPAVETVTTSRESRSDFSPGMAPLAPSSQKYQRYSEGCDGRVAVEEKGFLPTVLQQQQQQQQQPAKLRRIMGCFSRDSNGGRRQDTYRDTRQWQATSQGYDQRQQEWRQRWQEPWPAPPRACQEERRAVANSDCEDRSILSGGPPPRPFLESRGPRSQAVNLSFPSAPPPPIAPFPFPGRSGDDVGKGDSSGGQGAAEQARSGRTSLEDPATPYSEVPSAGACAARRRSFPLYSRLGGSAFALSKPDGGGGGIDGSSGGAVVVAPTSEHCSTVVGPEGEHSDIHDGTSIASNGRNQSRNHSRDYNKSSQFGARSLPALVRRISVGGGGGAGRVANRN